jgi:hypothetical protein
MVIKIYLHCRIQTRPIRIKHVSIVLESECYKQLM